MKNQVLRKSLFFGQSFLQRYGILILVLVFSLILSLYRIKECYPWMDEFFSISVAERPVAWIWNETLAPSKFNFNKIPPLYETILHFFWDTSATNLLLPRLLSIFFYLAALIALFSLTKLLFGQTAARLTVFFASLNYAYIYYGKMIRCYSLLNALSLISFYLYFKIIKEERFQRRYFLGLVAVNSLILYTNYFGAFVVILEALLAFSLLADRRLRQMEAWLSAAFVFFMPWFMDFWSDMSREYSFGYKGGYVPEHFWPAATARIKDGLFFDGPLSLIYIVIFFAMCAYGARRMRQKKTDGIFILSLGAILLIPVVAINLLTTPVPEASRLRYFLVFIFPFFIFAALAIVRSPKFFGIFTFFFLSFFSGKALLAYLNAPIERFWLADIPMVTLEAKSFPVSPSDRVVIEIEDFMFVPMFVYYFYGPRYFYNVSVPHNGHDLPKLRDLKPNYEVFSNLAAWRWHHHLGGLRHLKHADWFFLIYSPGMYDADWGDGIRGRPFKDFYFDRLKALGLEDSLTFIRQKSYANMTIDIYRVKRSEPVPVPHPPGFK